MKKINFQNPINPVLDFSEQQLKHRNRIDKAIIDGIIKFQHSKCFCGETDSRKILDYDAWGFNIPTVICKKCRTIRSEYFMDDDSLNIFYKDGFYSAHMFTNSNNPSGVGVSLDNYLREEINKGVAIKSWIENQISFDEIKNILEVGCGCGGILEAFSNKNTQCYGIDYNEEYIEYGRQRLKNIELSVGGIDSLGHKKFDLVILSDVVEHLNNPLAFLDALKKNMSANGILYINVPGFFGISFRRFGNNIRQFTKIEHLWCYSLNSLKLLMSNAGYTYINGTQEVRALFYSNSDKNRFDSGNNYDSNLFLYFFTRYGWFRNINYSITRIIEKITYFFRSKF